jgi:hypothetical protein
VAEPLSDVELAMLRVTQAEQNVAEQRERVARMKAEGRSSEQAELLLTNLANSLELSKARLAELISEARVYRCYLMVGDHIDAVRVLECAEDAEVFVRAAELLAAMREYQAIEIWNGKRLVGRIPKT